MFKRSKLKNEMGKLARQSGVLLETGKLKLQITQLENEIYNEKAGLGDVVYLAFQNRALQGENEAKEIEEICQKIADIEARIKELQSKIDALPDV